mgnify:CR=1 FL=1
MSELRRDPIIGRWNIIDTDQPAGAETFEAESHALGGGKCPFCYGNEAMTPPEIYVVRPPGGAANSSGWRLPLRGFLLMCFLLCGHEQASGTADARCRSPHVTDHSRCGIFPSRRGDGELRPLGNVA